MPKKGRPKYSKENKTVTEVLISPGLHKATRIWEGRVIPVLSCILTLLTAGSTCFGHCICSWLIGKRTDIRLLRQEWSLSYMLLAKGAISIVQGLSNHMALMLLIPIENIQMVSEEFITCPTATSARTEPSQACQGSDKFIFPLD